MFLYHIPQAPSEDTIQGPYGFVGLHAFPKSGHSLGFSLPTMTCPQRHSSGSSLSKSSPLLPPSYSSYSVFKYKPEPSIIPSPRHMAGPSSKYFFNTPTAF